MARIDQEYQVEAAITGRRVFSNNLSPVSPSQPSLRRSKSESFIASKKEEIITSVNWKTGPKSELMRYISYYYELQVFFGSPPWHIRDQLDALSSAFNILINATLCQLPPYTKMWVSIELPGDENHELHSLATVQRHSPHVLVLGRVSALDDICSAVLRKEISPTEGTDLSQKLCGLPNKFPSRNKAVLSFLCSFLLSGMLFGGRLNDMILSGILGSIVKLSLDMCQHGDESLRIANISFFAMVFSWVPGPFVHYSPEVWCFTALSPAGFFAMASGPGMLTGSLELAKKRLTFGLSEISLWFYSFYFMIVGILSMSQSLLSIVSFLNPGIRDSERRRCFNECMHDPSWSWYLQPLPWWSFLLTAPLFGLFTSMLHQQSIRSRQTFTTILYTTMTFYTTRVAHLQVLRISSTLAMLLICLLGSFSMGLYYSWNRQRALVPIQIHSVIQVLVLESVSTVYRAKVSFPLLGSQDLSIFVVTILQAFFMLVCIIVGLVIGASIKPYQKRDQKTLLDDLGELVAQSLDYFL